MIEDELRARLIERAEGLPDNPARIAEVRSRIAGIRRRRTAQVTASLVLAVLAGVALVRLPGTPDPSPTGAPSGPYFAAGGTSVPVAGYRTRFPFTFRGEAEWSAEVQVGLAGQRHVVVARCDDRGDLELRNRSGAGPTLRLSCRTRVDAHYEGALPIEPAQARELFAEVPGGGNVEVRGLSAGSWSVGLLEPLFPDRITKAEVGEPLLSGLDSPAGGRVTIAVPGTVQDGASLLILVFCVRGVQLQLRAPGGTLGVADCTDENVVLFGTVAVEVSGETLRRLGIRAPGRVSVDVRSTGRQTGEWAVVRTS